MGANIIKLQLKRVKNEKSFKQNNIKNVTEHIERQLFYFAKKNVRLI